ncbi:MAG: hypothetical protein QXO47_10655 [Thermoproteota archaeon]
MARMARCVESEQMPDTWKNRQCYSLEDGKTMITFERDTSDIDCETICSGNTGEDECIATCLAESQLAKKGSILLKDSQIVHATIPVDCGLMVNEKGKYDYNKEKKTVDDLTQAGFKASFRTVYPQQIADTGDEEDYSSLEYPEACFIDVSNGKLSELIEAIGKIEEALVEAQITPTQPALT